MTAGADLSIGLLGDLTVARDGRTLDLPPSRKTRALLGYLILAERPQPRSRLCDLFWDVTDDPRGALRWSLSRLRALVDADGVKRIVTGRDAVGFEPAGARIDLLEVREALARGAEALDTGALEALAGRFRGEPLEGLDLPDFPDYQAWYDGARASARHLHGQVLSALVERLGPEPDAALPHARAWVEVEPANEGAHARVVELLLRVGRPGEAERAAQQGRARLEARGVPLTGELVRALAGGAGVRGAPEGVAPGPAGPVAPVAPAGPGADSRLPVSGAGPPAGHAPPTPLVGRTQEVERLEEGLARVARERRLEALLLEGEAGAGKTRLLDALGERALAGGAAVLRAAAYEAELGRPYGPWIDALRQLHPAAVGDVLGAELALILPELSSASEGAHTRERLFGAVADLIAARAHSAPPVVLILDDLQWLDPASAALLHYVARTGRSRPVLLALAARPGELPDNPPVLHLLQALRREVGIGRLEVGPLKASETEEMVRAVAPDADGRRIHRESAGNALFALELARAAHEEGGGPPATVAGLVRTRLARLPTEAAELLQWAAVLAGGPEVEVLQDVAGLPLDPLLDALETLERHGFLRALGEPTAGRGDYVFAHDVVRDAVLDGLSPPRRRLMHRRVARCLADRPDAEAFATDVAHHAVLAGDPALAAETCVAAARRCVRVFAGDEARAFVDRGLEHAARLPEADRVRVSLELLTVAREAGRPRDPVARAASLEELADRALDLGDLEHARLGFHLLSQLRWEEGDWPSARRSSLFAEELSRSGGEREHMRAMAEAGRCLAMLERDLPDAEAMLQEAQSLAERAGEEPIAIPLAQGMLGLHRGEHDRAARLFDRARTAARRAGDRLDEFQALEQRVVLELQQEHYEAVEALTSEMVALGEKLRQGSEAPCARSLAALARYGSGDAAARAPLDEAIRRLDEACSKHRLAFVLNRAARVELARGDLASARSRAERALASAEDIRLPSEAALAHSTLVEVARRVGDGDLERRHAAALQAGGVGPLSAEARRAVQAVVGAGGARGRGRRPEAPRPV